mmetsp:Transcript_26612/g.32255  ORF Transcript_26612/g.32255 Transcript_26612/m.32255 type:complete len:144 (+) Transcript_26612:124-555(+)|eukprot:CAMPEP_0172505970 /NCGR_PEP_ID=MMETSP1066-20121228/190725_1 /TAXON_ID=671091 /ORGANISM="Coscinodiscus wailesii, Strain CCMP2513" /LENGTH=143 /DNA_ID=CAMNT_0013282785 /DNA_START=124 /DNA_END=555 /DNA_ORIENTATION=+
MTISSPSSVLIPIISLTLLLIIAIPIKSTDEKRARDTRIKRRKTKQRNNDNHGGVEDAAQTATMDDKPFSDKNQNENSSEDDAGEMALAASHPWVYEDEERANWIYRWCDSKMDGDRLQYEMALMKVHDDIQYKTRWISLSKP